MGDGHWLNETITAQNRIIFFFYYFIEYIMLRLMPKIQYLCYLYIYTQTVYIIYSIHYTENNIFTHMDMV